jgi:hypothetical protein
MDRALALLCAALLVTAPAVLASPSRAAAQEEEARLLFERGNQHLARGLRARGRLRQRELSEALDAYLGVLRLGARTRNVVFNLALTLQELGRAEEAFNYYSEYLRSFDLSAADRAEGRRRLEALRGEVAVLSITSTPEGAAVRVDRRDLPVRGETPLEIAVSEGAHRVFLEAEGYEDAAAEATAAIGRTAEVAVELIPEPVPVQVIAPSRGRLTLDGEPITAGTSVPVAPGPHVVRLEMEGAPPVDRRFEVQPGSAPMVLELNAGGAAAGPRLALTLDEPAAVFLDNVQVGRGRRVEVPVTPGEHEVRVEARGFNPATHRFRADGEERLALNVDLGRRASTGGLTAGRTISAIVATLGLATGGVLLGLATDARGRWEDEVESTPRPGGEEAANRAGQDLERFTLGTDIAFGITAAVGTLAIVLLAVDPGEGEASSIEVAASPTAGGGALQARLRWGAR